MTFGRGDSARPDLVGFWANVDAIRVLLTAKEIPPNAHNAVKSLRFIIFTYVLTPWFSLSSSQLCRNLTYSVANKQLLVFLKRFWLPRVSSLKRSGMFIVLRTPGFFRSVRSDMYSICATALALPKECVKVPA